MTATTTSSPPYSSVEEFFARSGYGKFLERQTFEARIRHAVRQAGFQAGRVVHVESHGLSTVTGCSLDNLDFRPMRQIRADLRRAFNQEGLNTTPSMITLYKAGSRLLAHVGILEPRA